MPYRLVDTQHLPKRDKRWYKDGGQAGDCQLVWKTIGFVSRNSNGGSQVSSGSESNLQEPSTYQLQEQLPRLPIPDLDSTADKFLHWVKPILTEAEYAQTESAVREFVQAGDDGEKLQQALIDWSRQDKVENWLEPFWDDLYLKNRVPIAVNISPCFSFRDLGMRQLEGAATLIRATLEFKKAVDAETLPVEFELTEPLCMMQYKRIFSTERVPGVERDELRSPLSENRSLHSEATYVVVMHQGNLYRMDVIDSDGNPLATNQIQHGLRAIVDASEQAGPNSEALGALTGMERPKWARAREELRLFDPLNAESLDTIEKALFAVAIESESSKDTLGLMGNQLHGDPKNRWYDKSFTYIAYPDGKLGLNIEHSGWDGSTVMNMAAHVVQGVEELRFETAAGGAASFSPIKFVVNQPVRNFLSEAREGYQKLADSTAIDILDFRAFGKELIKTFGVSPDGFIQAAFHLAQKRSWGFIGTTYEAAMTRRFKHGRTEALRTVTSEVVEFVSAVEDKSVPREQVQDRLKQAAAAHIMRMKECKEGRGIDRHLFGLLNIWQRTGEQLGIEKQPEIFSSPGWTKMRHDILSTSRLVSNDIEHFGFGPTTPDCTGIGYGVYSDNCIFVLSARENRRDELEAFTRNLEQALVDMAELFGNSPT
jgi:carnitine O-acetyltransferase